MSIAANRREWMKAAGAIGTAGIVASILPESRSAVSRPQSRPFRYCLNTSTIRGQSLPVDQQVKLAAEAGYDGVEPWIGDLDQFVEKGGSLDDLAKRIVDSGLTVESAIGFPTWIVDDESERKKGFEEAKRCMEIVRKIGGTRLAAPPAGATDKPGLDLDRAAERYAKLLEIGRSIGVTPQLEVWGFAQNLNRLAPVTYVAIACGQPDALILADAYHLYKGGSSPESLALLNGKSMEVFHINDYPNIDRATITDADRVYPGAGVGQVPKTLKILHDAGYRGALSLEVFNRDYWKLDPKVVVKTGLDAIKKCVEAAGLPV
jgi:2-keto-myo-inositol isomerase